MRYNDLKKIKKIYFSYHDIASILSISDGSAKVLASRYVKQGYLIRLKNNYYIFRDKWDNLDYIGKMKIANIIQVPSYISLMTALSYYEITTQVQQNYFESISIYRTFSREIEETTFKYSKIKKDIYFGFNKVKGLFISLPEKAFIDAVYLDYWGKYHLDISSIDLGKIDQKKLNQLLQIYSGNFKTYIKGMFK